MSRSKKLPLTSIFTVLALALGGYTYYEYKKADLHAGDTEQERRLFFFTPESVREFRIVRQDHPLKIVREGEDWRVVEPVQDLAEKSAVEALLYSVMIQKGRTAGEGAEGKSVAWSDFGLNPPLATIEVVTPAKTETLSVSSKNAYDGSYYLRQGDELLLGDHGLAQIVERDPSSVRAKRIFRDRDATVERVQVEVAVDKLHDAFTVTKDGLEWKVDPKPAYPLDMAKLESWLSSLHALSASEIASESLSEDQKREFLTLKPSLVVKMKMKDQAGAEKTYEFIAGQDRGDDVYLVTNTRPTVYKLSAGMLSGLRLPLRAFRDRKADFRFPLEQVQKLVVAGHVIEKTGSTWKLTNPKPSEEFSEDKFKAYMQTLGQLEASAYPAPEAAKGFTPQQKLTVLDGKGLVLFELSWGDEFHDSDPWNKGMTFRFVKTNLKKEVFGVNAAKIASLAEAGFVTTGAKQTDKK